MDDPRPAAIRGPVVTPPQGTEIQTEDQGLPVDPNDPARNSANVVNATIQVNIGATGTMYTVPAGKTLVVTSAIVSGGINLQYCALARSSGGGGSTPVAQGYHQNGVDIQLIQGSSGITFAAGIAVRFMVGSNSTDSLTCNISGYLQDPIAAVTAPALVQIQEIGLG